MSFIIMFLPLSTPDSLVFRKMRPNYSIFLIDVEEPVVREEETTKILHYILFKTL
jgi:hypothetical protein